MDGDFWYVYMLQSIGQPNRWYVGMTEGLQERLKAHNVAVTGWLDALEHVDVPEVAIHGDCPSGWS